MATTFKKGDVVKLAAPVPQGPVQALRMLDDGTVQCLIEWVDGTGSLQHRWFNETELTAV